MCDTLAFLSATGLIGATGVLVAVFAHPGTAEGSLEAIGRGLGGAFWKLFNPNFRICFLTPSTDLPIWALM